MRHRTTFCACCYSPIQNGDTVIYFDDTVSHVQCNENAERNHMNTEPTLQLLVIDLGDSSVLKLERGDEYKLTLRDGDFIVSQEAPTIHLLVSANEMRTAIDAQDEAPPVPRIEKLPQGYQLYSQPYGPAFNMLGLHYEAICQLAGKELSIYEPKKAGEWKQLMNNEIIDFPVSVWRYTKQ